MGNKVEDDILMEYAKKQQEIDLINEPFSEELMAFYFSDLIGSLGLSYPISILEKAIEYYKIRAERLKAQDLPNLRHQLEMLETEVNANK